jgi:hypothetical protein
MRHEERVGEIHCQGQDSRGKDDHDRRPTTTVRAVMAAGHFSLRTRSEQVLRDTECWLLHSLTPSLPPGPGQLQPQQAVLQAAHDFHPHVFRVSDRFIFGAGPWTLLAGKVCFPPLNVVSKLPDVRLRTGQAVLSTVDDSLTRVYWQRISGSWRRSASALDEEGKKAKQSCRSGARDSQ